MSQKSPSHCTRKCIAHAFTHLRRPAPPRKQSVRYRRIAMDIKEHWICRTDDPSPDFADSQPITIGDARGNVTQKRALAGVGVTHGGVTQRRPQNA